MLSDIHGRCDLKNRCLFLFTSIYGSCQLRIPEHIHDTVVTDPVTASEVFVGVVVKHAPAEASGDILLTRHGIQYVGVADGMLTAMLFVVKCLGGIHMSVVLTDEIWLLHIGSDLFLRITARHLSVMQEIIIRINIFQQMTFFDCPDTAGRSCGIQLMCHSIGLLIKRIIVRRLIDPHTPQNNGRMITVLPDHIFRICHRLGFPGFVTDVLPAGELCKY